MSEGGVASRRCSKKIENHRHAIALHYMYYKFRQEASDAHEAARWYPHDPRVAAGVADHVWTLEEVVGMLEARESILDLNTVVAI